MRSMPARCGQWIESVTDSASVLPICVFLFSSLSAMPDWLAQTMPNKTILSILSSRLPCRFLCGTDGPIDFVFPIAFMSRQSSIGRSNPYSRLNTPIVFESYPMARRSSSTFQPLTGQRCDAATQTLTKCGHCPTFPARLSSQEFFPCSRGWK